MILNNDENLIRPSTSPVKDIEKYYGNKLILFKYNKFNEKYTILVKPIYVIIFSIFVTINLAFILKYFII